MIKLKDYQKSCHWDKDRICENSFYCGMCEFQPADDDKPNGKNEPKHIKWVVEYGMTVPYCSSCGEMAYSTERCVFCGQKLLPTENPHKPEITIKGGKEDEDGTIRCEKCGSDNLKMVSHEDGRNFYGYTYRCECGNAVSVRTKTIGDRW